MGSLKWSNLPSPEKGGATKKKHVFSFLTRCAWTDLEFLIIDDLSIIIDKLNLPNFRQIQNSKIRKISVKNEENWPLFCLQMPSFWVEKCFLEQK